MDDSHDSRSGYHERKPGVAAFFGASGHEYSNSSGFDDAAESEENPEDGEQYSINAIWAQARDADGRAAIGFRGSMPWHLSEDLKHFKDLTVSHPVIMGRKTWESLPENSRPLSNRDNIVISSDPEYHAAGATVVSSLEQAIELAAQPAIPDDGIRRDEIWIIGGATLFNQAVKFADALFLTDIDAIVEADTYAPEISVFADGSAGESADGFAGKSADGSVSGFASGFSAENAFESDSGQDSVWQVAHDSGWLTSKNSKSTVERYRFRTLKRLSEPKHCANDENA